MYTKKLLLGVTSIVSATDDYNHKSAINGNTSIIYAKKAVAFCGSLFSFALSVILNLKLISTGTHPHYLLLATNPIPSKNSLLFPHYIV